MSRKKQKKCLYSSHEKVYGNCIFCGVKGGIPTYKEQCRAEADAVPQEVKQKYLDLLWAGKNIGDARAEVGISLNAATQITMDNISSFDFLNRTARA